MQAILPVVMGFEGEEGIHVGLYAHCAQGLLVREQDFDVIFWIKSLISYLDSDHHMLNRIFLTSYVLGGGTILSRGAVHSQVLFFFTHVPGF